MNTTTTISITRFDNIADAIAASCEEEQKRHAHNRSYNEYEYLRGVKSQKKLADNGEWLVINGFIYYLYKQTGRKTGMTLLNRLSLGMACIASKAMFQVFGLEYEEVFTRYTAGEIFTFANSRQNFEIIAENGRTFGKDSVITSCDKLFFAFQENN